MSRCYLPGVRRKPVAGVKYHALSGLGVSASVGVDNWWIAIHLERTPMT